MSLTALPSRSRARRPVRLAAWLLLAASAAAGGCAAIPEHRVEARYRNPFPQLARVAVLPFFNQSDEPTVNGALVAAIYRNELQAIPGFEVMPVGVAERRLQALGVERLNGATDFQALARALGVDAVVVGSVTDFCEFYPPRFGLAVNWYAANPSYHPIPAGYGLPWGTPEEEYIPHDIVRDAEFALARRQLETQTPPLPADALAPAGAGGAAETSWQAPTDPATTEPSAAESPADAVVEAESAGSPEALPLPSPRANSPAVAGAGSGSPVGSGLPPDWPDPRGFVPAPPSPVRPPANPQPRPVLEHIKQYSGADADLTRSLAHFYQTRDDARFGGWQAYLQRKEDFLRFCCYWHITEMLAARGGADESRVVWRWPIDRYQR